MNTSTYRDPMKTLYNEKYLKDTLKTISDELDELEKWSVWNGDHKLDEIKQVQDVYETLKRQLRKPACQHLNTMDAGDAERQAMFCVDCEKLL